MGGFNLQEMLAQARQQAEKLQEKMQQVVIEASSGGGSVTVKMNGQKQLLSVVIEPEVVKSGDIEMLQDLVVAAVNEAVRKVDEAMKSSLGGMFGGMVWGMVASVAMYRFWFWLKDLRTQVGMQTGQGQVR